MNALAVFRALEERIPTSYSCAWDNDGLMVCTAPEKEISRVLLTLDITDEAVEYAAQHGFDAILSHHPLIFHPLKQVTSPRIALLVRKDISAMSFHTRLDAISGGVNDALAEVFGLTDVIPFGEGGMGRIGTLQMPLSSAALAEKTAELLNSPHVRYVEERAECRRLALLGGSGGDFIAAARAAGADAFLTGEASYHDMMDAAGGGMTVLTAGHYETEQPVLHVLSTMLREMDAGIETELFECSHIRTASARLNTL